MELLFSVVLVLAGSVVSQRRSPSAPCAHNLCLCYPRENIAHCDKHNLTYIPKLPTYITRLVFSRNRLKHVSQGTFQNLTSMHLVELNITSNSIRTITTDAFSNLVHLRSLSLNGNVLSGRMILRLFRSIGKLSLSTLSFAKTKLRNTEVFRQFNSSTLQNLILDNNRIALYNQSHYTFLSNLKILSLSHNYIKSVKLDSSFSLQYLRLRNNKIGRFPNFCVDKTSFPNLERLKLDHNSLDSIDGDNLRCMQKLNMFSLNHNTMISNIKQNTFTGLPLLKNLILRGLLGISKIEKYAFNNSQIKYISLTGSHIEFKKGVDKDAFRGLSSIDSLDVSFNELLNSSKTDFDEWFGHLTSLTGLGLGNAHIQHYPLFIPMKLRSLMYLKLYGNYLHTLPIGAFTPLKNLTHLWLSNNMLTKIDEKVFPRHVQRRLRVIDLMSNPFACNCELLWFLQWTKSHPEKFPKYPKKYTCASPGDMKGKMLSHVGLTEYKCLLSFPMTLTVIGSAAVFLVIVLLVSLIRRWRWHIRYFLNTRRNMNRRRGQVELYYDAYVIYSQADIRWIKAELIENMENDLGKKLYIRDRDSLPGDPVVNNVVNNMAKSRYILIILSQAMVRDEECQFELMFVQGQRTPSILVLLEEVQTVTHSVYALVKTHSYITWDEDRHARELFWTLLDQSMNNGGHNE